MISTSLFAFYSAILICGPTESFKDIGYPQMLLINDLILIYTCTPAKYPILLINIEWKFTWSHWFCFLNK